MSDVAALLADLAQVSFPTLGHVLEEGFADPLLRQQTPGRRLLGRAATLQLADHDACAVNHALLRLQPGEVLVIATGGDRRHACIGLVTASAALVAGAHGLVVDGLVTDSRELVDLGLPVFAYGTSLCTTKLRDLGTSRFGVEIHCAGVKVRPGDLVLGDDNGVLFLSPSADLAATVIAALATAAAEPPLLPRLRDGNPLAEVLAIPCSTVDTSH